MKNFKVKYFLLFTIFSLAAVTVAQAVTVKMSLDQTSVAVNQQLTLTIELSGESANKASQPEPPVVSDFLDFLGSGGSSQNIQIVNGKMDVTKSFTYYYMAAKVGTYIIPAISVEYKGKKYYSQPISVTITKSASPTQQATPQGNTAQTSGENFGDNLFIRPIVNKTRVYQNEPVVVTFRLYLKVNIQNVSNLQLPETTGFWTEEFETSNQLVTREEVYNGQRYTVADIKKIALFPTSSGKKTIGAMGLDCDVRVQSRRRSRDIFDSFFDDPFFGRTVRKSIYSKPVNIEVLPIPQTGRPANFSGMVGKFNLNASLDKTNVKANDAVSLKITISGEGNIKQIPKPDVFIPNDFEQYEPKVTESINRKNDAVTGSKTFEYVLIPRFPGQHIIKPVTFTYFNPAEKQFKTVSSKQFVVDVEKGDQELVPLSTGVGKEEVKFIGQDIRFIKLSSSDFKKKDNRVYKSGTFILLLVMPLVLLAFSFGYKKHEEKLSGNIAYARSRKANRTAMKRLSKAKSLLSEDTQKQFYAQVSSSLVGFAADKLNLSEAGVISTELEKHFVSRNLDPEFVKEYLSLIQECDFQRFAPANVQSKEMQAFFNRAKESIIQLEKAI